MGAELSGKTRIILLVITFIVIAWGCKIVVDAGFDLYWTIDTVGLQYYGGDFLSKENTSVDNAALFANAKKVVTLAKMRNFPRIGAGAVMMLAGMGACLALLYRKRKQEEKGGEK